MGSGPKAFVVRGLALLLEERPAGTALDLACGEGQTTRHLLDLGWTVTGVDLSDVGLAKARALAPQAHFLELDLERDFPNGSWDLVTCVHYYDPGLVPRVRAAASAVLFEVLVSGVSPSFCAQPGEVHRWFADWDVLLSEEDEHTARLLALRPGLRAPR